MIKVVGLKTNKIYAEGHKVDCFRHLHEQYPTPKSQRTETMYPEPLKILPIKKGLLK